ncbi:Dynein heavy chain 10, axonemal [Bulinus truncatus]|nr:Dynein heavy chain 10, axonemal [Bulinus truncatus]
MLSATLENVEYPAPELEAVMIQALVWSLGAALVEDSRVRFDTYLKYLASMSVIYDPNKLPEPGELPGNGILFDYHFDQVKKKWIAWSKRVPAYVHVPGQKFYDILVPTVETVRATWLLELHVTIRRPVVLVGETGTSKTATILNFLKKINEETTMLLVMNFSSRTTSLDVQRNLEANMEKRTKDTYGPPSNKRLIIYIDELNMPQVDTYGTQQPIAMLKLLLDRGGTYDRGKELCWKNMRDLGYIASMGKAGGGRNETDPRFVSLFSVFNMTFPDQTSLLKIYVSILDGHLRPFESDLVRYVVKITEMTMELYSHLIKELPPTPSKFHYIFNLRDLSRIYNGLCLSTPDRFSNINQFLRLWRNECMRVICDRLITVEDKHQVQEHILRLIKEYFKEAHMDNISRDPILFGDFRFALDEEEPRIYEDLQDYEACKALFHEIMEDYNEVKSSMRLVLFDDALEHLTRIHRVLRMDRGNSLLVGVGGSGKQSLCQLASHAARCEVFQIMLSRGYNENSFSAENLHLKDCWTADLDLLLITNSFDNETIMAVRLANIVNLFVDIRPQPSNSSFRVAVVKYLDDAKSESTSLHYLALLRDFNTSISAKQMLHLLNPEDHFNIGGGGKYFSYITSFWTEYGRAIAQNITVIITFDRSDITMDDELTKSYKTVFILVSAQSTTLSHQTRLQLFYKNVININSWDGMKDLKLFLLNVCGKCTTGWAEFTSVQLPSITSCYKIMKTKDPISSFEAEKICSAHKSDLVNIESKEELQFLKIIFTSYKTQTYNESNCLEHRIPLGFRLFINNKQIRYQWSNGRPFLLGSHRTIQKLSYDKFPSCVSMVVFNKASSIENLEERLIDHDCTSNIFHIVLCEFDMLRHWTSFEEMNDLNVQEEIVSKPKIMFNCENNDEYLNYDKVCDGIQDCLGGRDEHYCPVDDQQLGPLEYDKNHILKERFLQIMPAFNFHKELNYFLEKSSDDQCLFDRCPNNRCANDQWYTTPHCVMAFYDEPDLLCMVENCTRQFEFVDCTSNGSIFDSGDEIQRTMKCS